MDKGYFLQYTNVILKNETNIQLGFREVILQFLLNKKCKICRTLLSIKMSNLPRSYFSTKSVLNLIFHNNLSYFIQFNVKKCRKLSKE